MTGRIAFFLAVLALTGCGYNNIQSTKEAASASHDALAQQLQRRTELVPGLSDVVKNVVTGEDTVFARLADTRTKLQEVLKGGDLVEMAQANSRMTGALSRLLLLGDANADLRIDPNYVKLKDEIAAVDREIGRIRTERAKLVEKYNAQITEFPVSLTAKVTGARPLQNYEVTAAIMRATAPPPKPKADSVPPAPRSRTDSTPARPKADSANPRERSKADSGTARGRSGL